MRISPPILKIFIALNLRNPQLYIVTKFYSWLYNFRKQKYKVEVLNPTSNSKMKLTVLTYDYFYWIQSPWGINCAISPAFCCVQFIYQETGSLLLGWKLPFLITCLQRPPIKPLHPSHAMLSHLWKLVRLNSSNALAF